MARQSPWDLMRAIRASPGLKLNSPGRRTCQMDRPDNNISLISLKKKTPTYGPRMQYVVSKLPLIVPFLEVPPCRISINGTALTGDQQVRSFKSKGAMSCKYRS